MSNIKQFPIRMMDHTIERLHRLSLALSGRPRRTGPMVEAWIIERLLAEEKKLKP